jgi:hypothetical protein
MKWRYPHYIANDLGESGEDWLVDSVENDFLENSDGVPWKWDEYTVREEPREVDNV